MVVVVEEVAEVEGGGDAVEASPPGVATIVWYEQEMGTIVNTGNAAYTTCTAKSSSSYDL